MNEKHYDNLCEIAKKISAEGSHMYLAIWAQSFLNQDCDAIETLAGLYNALDILCIALDCEDDVQDMAEKLAAESVSHMP